MDLLFGVSWPSLLGALRGALHHFLDCSVPEAPLLVLSLGLRRAGARYACWELITFEDLDCLEGDPHRGQGSRGASHRRFS